MKAEQTAGTIRLAIAKELDGFETSTAADGTTSIHLRDETPVQAAKRVYDVAQPLISQATLRVLAHAWPDSEEAKSNRPDVVGWLLQLIENSSANGFHSPDPELRDVIRHFLKLGGRLVEWSTTNGNCYWRYETDQRTKGGLRELVDVLHFPTESTWIVKLGLYGPHQVTLRNPSPAQVLTAARLVGLGGSDV